MIETIDYISTEEELQELTSSLKNSLDKLSVAITTSDIVDDDISTESLEAVMHMVNYDLSTEVDANIVFKQNLNDLYKKLNGYIYKQFKGFSPLVKLTNEYRTTELVKLKKLIEDGVLVPRESIDQTKVTNLNNKLAVFYASGYSLERNGSDLTKFISGMFELTNRSGKYINGIRNMYIKLSKPDKSLEIPKLSGLLNVKKTLIGLQSTIERKVKITDFRLSIITKFISSNVTLLFVSNSPKRGIRVHTDTFKVNTNRIIGTPDNNTTLKLLDAVIKNSSNLDGAHKNISLAIKLLTRDNTLQLISSIAGENKAHRFLVAKYAEGVTNALINLYIDIVHSDKLVIDYIKATYRKA